MRKIISSLDVDGRAARIRQEYGFSAFILSSDALL